MDFAFTKKNYMLLFVGLAFIASGIILMIGGGSEDPNKFSDEIFNTQRLTIAPILLAVGFVVEIFAIMYKEK
tara:strand:- start:279 stop:494 length:216 start_codon:yes stop_codon:yes gene_type:complete